MWLNKVSNQPAGRGNVIERHAITKPFTNTHTGILIYRFTLF